MENLSLLTMDDAIKVVAKDLKENSKKHYLHKSHGVHTPDSRLKFRIMESIFTDSQDEQFKMVAKQFLNANCLCYGMHNGRVVFKINDYFNAAPPCVWADKFSAEKIDAKGRLKIEELNAARCDKLTKTIAAYGAYVSDEIKSALGLKNDDFDPKYYFFESIECDNIENNGIYSRIKQYYNDELNAKDVRTDTPLAESYFTLIGWLFSPKDKALRIAGCLECTTSGIGKTSFIRELCRRSEVVYGCMSQSTGRSNQFSFSPVFALGPDIITVDDPCQGTSDILQEMSTVVSNGSAKVELKSKDRYELSDVYTRFYISTNVPLYMRNDSNNFMNKKLFVLKVNDIADNKEHIASAITKYISYCEKNEVHEFLTYCVSLFQSKGKQFIADHLGLYIDHESVSNLFADVFSKQDVEGHTNCKTLIECVNSNMARTDSYHDDEILKNWNKVAKFIKDNYPEVAAKTVCSVPSNNAIYAVGSRPSKSRYKNYLLTPELREIVLKLIANGD